MMAQSVWRIQNRGLVFTGIHNGEIVRIVAPLKNIKTSLFAFKKRYILVPLNKYSELKGKASQSKYYQKRELRHDKLYHTPKVIK